MFSIQSDLDAVLLDTIEKSRNKTIFRYDRRPKNGSKQI